MREYIKLDASRFSKYAEMAFIDIEEDGKSMFDSITCDVELAYKRKGNFASFESGPYQIAIIRFKKKYTDVIIERIKTLHNKALLCGYNELEKWMSRLDAICGDK